MSKTYSWKAEFKAVGDSPENMTDEDRAALEKIPQQNEEFFQKFPTEKIVPQILRKAKSERSTQVRTLAFRMLPMVAAAALAFLFLPKFLIETTDDTRIKGNDSVSLLLYRQTPSGQPEALTTSKKVKAGDVLQATYLVKTSVQGVILSVDGNRNVTVHLADRGKSVGLLPGKEQPLDFSYELDRAPSYEAFFLFTSNKPFEIEPLRQILKTTGLESMKETTFGDDIHWTRVVLNKETAP